MLLNINFEGIKNARDLGGIPNREGREIRSRCFVRSAGLSSATENDELLLRNEYTLSKVIDLRTATERNEKPDRFMEGVEYLHFPLFEESVIGVTHERSINSREMLDHLPSMEEMYQTIITDEVSLLHLRSVFRTVVSHDGMSTLLWHCTEGKDRCGIVSALVLTLLDCDRETVFDDYVFTNRSAVKRANGMFALVLLVGGGIKKAKTVRSLFLADPKYLSAVFDEIDRRHGGTDSFFRNELGIDGETKRAFGERFLLPGR